MSQLQIVQNILDERAEQDIKWGVQRHDSKLWLAILVEEAGEVAKAILEKKATEVRRELIHTAAVCIAWLEHIDGDGLPS